MGEDIHVEKQENACNEIANRCIGYIAIIVDIKSIYKEKIQHVKPGRQHKSLDEHVQRPNDTQITDKQIVQRAQEIEGIVDATGQIGDVERHKQVSDIVEQVYEASWHLCS